MSFRLSCFLRLFSFRAGSVRIVLMTELKAKSRTELGRKSNALRRAGFLPAVLYGEKVKSMPIAVSRKDFDKAYKELHQKLIDAMDFANKNGILSKYPEFEEILNLSLRKFLIRVCRRKMRVNPFNR